MCVRHPLYILVALAILAVCLAQVSTLPRPTQSALTAPRTAPDGGGAADDLSDYLARSAALKPDDVDGHLDLARWCRDRRMWPQAFDMAEVALYQDPYNRAAYTILQQIDEARPMALEPDKEASLKTEFAAQFGHPFNTINSRHFILCFDTTDTFARQRSTAMENVYNAFQFYFNMSTLHPDFLQRRLVVILFKERSDYLVYLKATDRADLSWSAGFYSQRTNVSAFYDDTSGPAAAGAVKQEDDLRAKIDALNAQIRQATAQGQTGMANQFILERNRLAQTLTQVTGRTDNAIDMLNNSKTLHEAAHQIAFNTGIQKRLIDYPLWLTEGLACSFETEDGAGRRGPAVLNFGRIAVLKDALKADSLIPLDKLITQAQPEKTDEASIGLFYAEAWGLFHYLYRFERNGMEKFLLAYRARRPLIATDADTRRKLFTDAFGDDFDTLEKKYFAYLKALPAKPGA